VLWKRSYPVELEPNYYTLDSATTISIANFHCLEFTKKMNSFKSASQTDITTLFSVLKIYRGVVRKIEKLPL
jgi:hypothetical protein